MTQEIKGYLNTELDPIHNKLGRVVFSQSLLNSTNTKHLQLIFSNFFPIDIFAGEDNRVTYMCLSHHFLEIQNNYIPKYEVVFQLGETQDDVSIKSVTIVNEHES